MARQLLFSDPRPATFWVAAVAVAGAVPLGFVQVGSAIIVGLFGVGLLTIFKSATWTIHADIGAGELVTVRGTIPLDELGAIELVRDDPEFVVYVTGLVPRRPIYAAPTRARAALCVAAIERAQLARTVRELLLIPQHDGALRSIDATSEVLRLAGSAGAAVGVLGLLIGDPDAEVARHALQVATDIAKLPP